jgi:predicted RNase H-like HicB family nuclease
MDRFRAIFERDGEQWVAYAEDLPGASARAGSLEEARERLRQTIRLVVEEQVYRASREHDTRPIVREDLLV